MDAKWNSIIDNFAVRAGLYTFGFAMWVAASVALIAAA
jgi:hypothetical protein